VDGTLSVASVHFSPRIFECARDPRVKDNWCPLPVASRKIDGGNYSGNITLDRRGATPSFKPG